MRIHCISRSFFEFGIPAAFRIGKINDKNGIEIIVFTCSCDYKYLSVLQW